MQPLGLPLLPYHPFSTPLLHSLAPRPPSGLLLVGVMSLLAASLALATLVGGAMSLGALFREFGEGAWRW